MNPLFAQNAPKSQSNNSDVQTLINTIKLSNNPAQAFSVMAQNNPAIRNVINMCNGRNPQDVFLEECSKRGINPQDIIKLLR